MAASILVLLDDIAALTKSTAAMTKDVSVITKTAMQKTAGVLGDDLALNAEQVSGVDSKRELPVIFAVFKGSILNKVILIPVAMVLYTYLPLVFAALLMVGGAFLAYEGAHAVLEKFFHKKETSEREEAHIAAIKDTNVDMVAVEKDKIKGAVRTDFILSAEIIAIALSTMKDYDLTTRILGLTVTALAITIAVYGLVALLIRFDDIGFALKKKTSSIAQSTGQMFIVSVPYIMSTLSWFGMIALFMVGGGILLHGVPALAHATEDIVKAMTGAGFMNGLVMTLVEAMVAVVIGFFIVFIHEQINKIRKKTPTTH